MSMLKALAIGFVAFVIIGGAFNAGDSIGFVGAGIVTVVAYIYFRGVNNVARIAGSATARVEEVAKRAASAFNEGRNSDR